MVILRNLGFHPDFNGARAARLNCCHPFFAFPKSCFLFATGSLFQSQSPSIRFLVSSPFIRFLMFVLAFVQPISILHLTSLLSFLAHFSLNSLLTLQFLVKFIFLSAYLTDHHLDLILWLLLPSSFSLTGFWSLLPSHPLFPSLYPSLLAPLRVSFFPSFSSSLTRLLVLLYFSPPHYPSPPALFGLCPFSVEIGQLPLPSCMGASIQGNGEDVESTGEEWSQL